MNIMLRQTSGGKTASTNDERRKRDKEVVKKILEENEKFRTRTAFYEGSKGSMGTTTMTGFGQTQGEIGPKQLKVYPDEIIFKNVKENQTYEINVMVRNLTKSVKRIRIIQPTTSKFRCDYDVAGLLAPGLAFELIISFSTTVAGEFHDKVVIMCDGDYKTEIPLHAYSPMPSIVFEPFVNFGFIPIGQERRQKVRFVNEGSVAGKVDLRFSDLPDFRIEPSTPIKIQAEKSVEFEFIYTPREAGIFRGIVEVYLDGQSFMNHIDVNATSVEFLKFIVDTEGIELKKVEFGDVFFGQRKENKGFLVNNSPKPLKFKVTFIHGLHNNFDERYNLKTPQQEGFQQTQRIMQISPSEGVVEPYSQIPISFSCSSKVTEDHHIWVRNNSFKRTRTEKKALAPTKGGRSPPPEEVVEFDDKCQKNHEYTALFNFEGSTDSNLLMMTAHCICPRVNFGEENTFDFGTVMVNEVTSKTIDVSNMHSNLEVEVNLPNVSVFYVVPAKIKLKPGEKKTIELFFYPKSLGKFSRQVDFIVNKIYPVSVTFIGHAKEIAQKSKKVVGPLPVDFDHYDEKEFIEELKRQDLPDEMKASMTPSHGERTATSNQKRDKVKSKTGIAFKPNPRLLKVIETTTDMKIPQILTAKDTEVFDQYQIAKLNTKTANDYLTSMRLEREMMKKKGYILGQNKIRNERIKGYAGKQGGTAGDGALATFTKEERLESPRLNLPSEVDTLFVMKPIGTYEPYPMYNFSANFAPDFVNPEQFTDKPSSQAEARDISTELTGEELQKIQVGPTEINFGEIFLKSVDFRYFQIKNDLRKPILARLVTEGNKELEDTYHKPQIIPSGKTASFKIVLSSYNQQNFDKTITYIINEKHTFRILVQAKIIPVTLTLKKSDEEFVFEDEKTDMKIEREITIMNHGNAPATFHWMESRLGCFSIFPMDGEVNRNSNFTVKITYTPSGDKSTEEEDLIMKVEDGPHCTLSCRASLNEVKCEFSQPAVDFGILCVSERRVMTTLLENLHTKNFAIFAVDTTSLPSGLEISPTRDRIPPADHAKFELTFCNPTPVKFENREVRVQLRGDKPKILLVSAQTIIPDVKIKEEEFNFGEVTFGNTESLVMTLVNDSQIDIMLTLDLREKDNDPESESYSRLEIKYIGDHDNEEEQVLEEKDIEDIMKPEFKDMKGQGEDLMEDDSDEDNSPTRQHNHAGGSRYYTLKLKKKKAYEFELRFSPKLVKGYKFTLPISLAGFERISSLSRKVYCQGIKPKVTMDPPNGELVFEKKTITSTDSVVPQHMSITFMNSHNTRPLPFKIDTSAIKRKEVFTVIPTQGTIDSQVPVTIKVSFKPVGNEKYEEEVPLYLEDDGKPYATIRLKGEGAYPKILFDRREVIMPIVPLGVESRCTFKIENEGYQNLILKHYLAQDIGTIKLKVDFPDGKTLGTSTNTLRVDLSFMYSKPISFTAKLVFEDDSKQIYPIYISGTSDNCLLTNYPFFQVSGDDFKLVAEPNKPVRLEANDNDGGSEITGQGNDHPQRDHSRIGSFGSKSVRSTVGFSPIPMSLLESTCKFCMNWLNNFVLVNPIENFPTDLITTNGQPIFEMISFLTKRNPPQMSKIDAASKKLTKIEVLHKQYSDLLHFLKENGAMLNTIRPEYLLSHSDLLAFYKKTPMPYVLPSVNKISEKYHKYVSMDAWTTLFYQILKVYYLCRVTPKLFKSMKELPGDKGLLPEIYTEQNPVYSTSEMVLLRWAEIGIETQYPALTKPRLVNFDGDFQNGLAFGGLLQLYIWYGNKSKRPINLKTSINSDEDKKNNIERVKNVMKEYGILSMPEMFEGRVSSRDVVIYLVHLFQMLPFFIPKGTLEFPVMLKGNCIRSITLNNNSNKKITYAVKLEVQGSAVPTDFTIAKDFVDILPKETESFQIKYTARISKLITGRITFRNKRDTGPQATPVVYDLVSEVQGRNSEAVINVDEEVLLYDSATFEITVQNPYNQSVNFTISVENIPVAIDDGKKKKLNVRKKEEERVFIPAFFCKAETISIAKNGSAKLPISYMPVTLEPHKCFIIFTDDKVGEMQYEVNGEPQTPAAMESKPEKVVAQLDNMDTKFLDVKPKNHRMDYALAKLKDKVKESKSLKNKTELLKRVDSLRENNTFTLECDQPFIQIPNTFTIVSTKKMEGTEHSKGEKSDTHNLSATGEMNKIPINLAYKFPVQNQVATIMMRNSTRTDVRIYQLEITVMPKKVKALLEMTTPARIPLTQVIPIINTLDSEVFIKVTMERVKNGEAFRLPFTQDQQGFKVGREPYQLKLVFEPEWVYEALAKLTLNNRDTNEHFEYELRGVGEEPLAEKEFIVECKLKEEKTIYIDLEVMRKINTLYQVEIDLPYSKGADTLEVPANKAGRYPLKITPLLGGEFTGSVTFKADNGIYWWYMFTLKVESSKFERHLDMLTHCRKPVVQEIELENPLNETISFKVVIDNDALTGAQNVMVPSLSKVKYPLTFLPLKECSEKTTVTFVNPKIGDVIYDILLVSDPAPQVRVNQIRCEVGKSERTVIKLENVLKDTVQVTARYPDNSNFYLTSDTFMIPPSGTLDVEVFYTPSELDKFDKAVIIFDSKQIGTWNFLVSGIGVPPTKYPALKIAGSLGKQSSNSVTFKNPFRDPVSVNVFLDADERSREVFEIVLKKSKITVAGQQYTDISFNFLPKEITDYFAEIVVQLNDKVSWRYPISASTESINLDTNFRLETQCHATVESTFSFELPGITKITPGEVFDIQVDLNNKDLAPVIKKWCQIEPEVKSISSATDQLRYQFKFTPHKPFKSSGMINITKPSGGVWKYVGVLTQIQGGV